MIEHMQALNSSDHERPKGKMERFLPQLDYIPGKIIYLCRVINNPGMKKQLTLLILMAAAMVSCSDRKAGKEAEQPIDTIPSMVMRIQKTSRLYTTEYHIHKIITHDDTKKLTGSFMSKDFSIDLPIGKRRIAIPMDATVKAYIDFSGFSDKNIRRKGNKIEVILPDPKIILTSTKVNHDDVKQYVPLFRGNFSDEELTAYERQGREAIIRDLPELDLIGKSRASAARTLIPLFSQMGFRQDDVTVTFRKQFTISDIPALIDKSTIENGTNHR